MELAGWARCALAAGGALAAGLSFTSCKVGGWASALSSSQQEACLRFVPSWGKGKVVLVTGGSGLVGLKTAGVLARAGATVVLACRSLQKGEAAKESLGLTAEEASRVQVMALDLGSLKSVAAFAEAFLAKFQRLHVLLLNAGVARSLIGYDGYRETEDGFEEMMGVNFLGHFLLTGLLMPLLRASSAEGCRVIGLTSVAMANSYGRGIDVQSWTKKVKDFQDWKQYGQSKLAMRLFSSELQRREPSILSVSCHPCVVNSGLLHQGPKSWQEWIYSWALFSLLAMGPKCCHLTCVYLATAPASELEPGACYQPLARRLHWMSSYFQRIGGLQAPIPMKTEHPGLWDAAEQLLNERTKASLGRALLPAA